MKARITAIIGIGNVILGEMQIFNIERVEDKDCYWNLVINENAKTVVNKKNWNLEIFVDDREYRETLISEILESVKRNPLTTKNIKEVEQELKKEHIAMLEKMRGMRICY